MGRNRRCQRKDYVLWARPAATPRVESDSPRYVAVSRRRERTQVSVRARPGTELPDAFGPCVTRRVRAQHLSVAGPAQLAERLVRSHCGKKRALHAYRATAAACDWGADENTGDGRP